MKGSVTSREGSTINRERYTHGFFPFFAVLGCTVVFCPLASSAASLAHLHEIPSDYQVLGGWFDTDWWSTPGNRERGCFLNEYNSSSNNNSVGVNSDDNDLRRPISTGSKSQDGLKEELGPGGSDSGGKNLVKSGQKVGAAWRPDMDELSVEHDSVDPWMRGMRRMVDGNAPLVRIFRQEVQHIVISPLV